MPLWGSIALTLLWALATLFWRANRIWLPYYITGAVGLAFVLIFFAGRAGPLQEGAQAAAVWSVHHISSLVAIPTRVFAQEPGAILILVVSQDIGWTMLQVSIESSGLLEVCVLASMVWFYPGWTMRKKGMLILVGVIATFIANVVRLMVITITLHYLGKDSLLLAHVVVGRVVFFVLVVLIFWMVITLPTLKSVREKLEREARF